MPGPNERPTLIVTGKATVPTGGYRFAWRDMRVMESYPVQISVELEAIPPSGGATQASRHPRRARAMADEPAGGVADHTLRRPDAGGDFPGRNRALTC
ncbi:MAG: hypothetical protein M3438_00375 [Pseudomonadota bacterium]|nr:hypothetical protein [Sphingomonas sp.]MDQ3477610.1 hypothetical protein [Pseudomonadota bacterium]